MPICKHNEKNKHLAVWFVGFLALFWVLIRSGTNPKRLLYPCQRAAIPIAINWILAVVALLTGSLLLCRLYKFSALAIMIVGAIWLMASVPNSVLSDSRETPTLPEWKVAAPVSKLFVMDEIPYTSGSLNAGDASVPDEYLKDPAIDTLLEKYSLPFCSSSCQPPWRGI